MPSHPPERGASLRPSGRRPRGGAGLRKRTESGTSRQQALASFRALFGPEAESAMELLGRISPEWEERVHRRLVQAFDAPARHAAFLSRLQLELAEVTDRAVTSEGGPTSLKGPLPGIALKPVEAIDFPRWVRGQADVLVIDGGLELRLPLDGGTSGRHLVVRSSMTALPVVRLQDRASRPEAWTLIRKLSAAEVRQLSLWFAREVRRGRTRSPRKARALLESYAAALETLAADEQEPELPARKG